MTMLKWIVAPIVLASCGFPRPAEVTSCTPGKFAECQGDATMTCNSAGNGYDTVQCAMGCDASIGCRLCEPSQTVCTNGTVQTCDATGAIISSESCPLGCFQDQPRCTDIDPSNGLAMYMDMAVSASDLDLSSGGTIYTDTGDVQTSAKAPVPVLSFLVAAPPNGAAIRVIVANHVHLGGAISVGLQNFAAIGPALAIIANDKISVAGTLSFVVEGTTDQVSLGTAGGVAFDGCIGGLAQYTSVSTPALTLYESASGGGGHATAGAAGGSVSEASGTVLSGGAGGHAMGNETLVPLRGGCAGGNQRPSGTQLFNSSGGGALQLSSRTEIAIADNATVNLNAPSSYVQEGGPESLFGGGAGGGLLIEAPVVQVGDSARLLVNGAAGSIIDMPVYTSEATAATKGLACFSATNYFCSKAGDGASLNGPATAGGDVPFVQVSGQATYQAGSGGGGLGFIRITTATGSYTKATDAIESGMLTTGMIGTR